MGLREKLHNIAFNYLEFEAFKNMAGANVSYEMLIGGEGDF